MGRGLPVRRAAARPSPVPSFLGGAPQAVSRPRLAPRRRRRGGDAVDAGAAAARDHRKGRRPRGLPPRAREAGHRGPRRRGQPHAHGSRRAPHPAQCARGDLLVAPEVGSGPPRDPARGWGHRDHARDAPVRVRRRPRAPGRDPHGRERGPPRPRRPRTRPRRLRGLRRRGPERVRDGDRDRRLALHDPVRRGPLHAREEGRARAHGAHPPEVSEGHDRRRPLRGRGALRAARGAQQAQVGPFHTNTKDGLALSASSSCAAARATGRSS